MTDQSAGAPGGQERRDTSLLLQLAESVGEVRATMPQIVARVEAVEQQAARFDAMARKLDTVERQVGGVEQQVSTVQGHLSAVEQGLVGLQTHLTTQDAEQSHRLDAIDAKIASFQQLADQTPVWSQRFDMLERSTKNMDLFVASAKSLEEHRRAHMQRQDAQMAAIKKMFSDGYRLIAPGVFVLLISNLLTRTHPGGVWNLAGIALILVVLFGTAGFYFVRWLFTRGDFDDRFPG